MGSVSIWPTCGIDEVGLVPLPTGLVLLGPAVVVDREQDGVAVLRGGAEVDGRLAAVAADLEHRAVDRDAGGRVVEREPFVRRHEAAGCFGGDAEAFVHQSSITSCRRGRSGRGRCGARA